MTEFLIA